MSGGSSRSLRERKDAIIYRGDEKETYEKALQVMEDHGIPKQLVMPLKELQECGGVEATGHIWLKQKSQVKHHFKNVDSYVCFAPEISCVLEKKKMKKVMGVKARKKFLPFYVPVVEVYVDDAEPPYIHFVTHGGIKDSHPLHIFCSSSSST